MKKLFSIGEIATKLNQQTHTIRFWTDEFEAYVPFEIGKGQRRYYPEEAMEVFIKIHHLIHEEGIKIRIIKEKMLLKNESNTALYKLQEIKQEVIKLLSSVS